MIKRSEFDLTNFSIMEEDLNDDDDDDDDDDDKRDRITYILI
jgi:hypothetical protein